MSGQHSITPGTELPGNHVPLEPDECPQSYRGSIRATRLTLPDFFENVAPTNRAANRWLIQARWPDGPRCAHCGSRDVQEEVPQDEEVEIWFRCNLCERFFTVRTNHFTAYPDVSCRQWLLAIYLTVSEPRFWSETQIADFLGLDETKTGLVIHAIHLQMQLPDPHPLESVGRKFEADEACWPKHMNSAAGERFAQRLYTLLVLERATGQVRIEVVANRDCKTLVDFLKRSGLRVGDYLNVDGLIAYVPAAWSLLLKLRRVFHDVCRWVSVDNPEVHINGAESCFAWMRHALSRIEISQENLARYVAQVEFMINHREVPVIERIRVLASREHGPLTPERIEAERSRFAPEAPRPALGQPQTLGMEEPLYEKSQRSSSQGQGQSRSQGELRKGRQVPTAESRPAFGGRQDDAPPGRQRR